MAVRRKGAIWPKKLPIALREIWLSLQGYGGNFYVAQWTRFYRGELSKSEAG